MSDMDQTLRRLYGIEDGGKSVLSSIDKALLHLESNPAAEIERDFSVLTEKLTKFARHTNHRGWAEAGDFARANITRLLEGKQVTTDILCRMELGKIRMLEPLKLCSLSYRFRSTDSVFLERTVPIEPRTFFLNAMAARRADQNVIDQAYDFDDTMDRIALIRLDRANCLRFDHWGRELFGWWGVDAVEKSQPSAVGKDFAQHCRLVLRARRAVLFTGIYLEDDVGLKQHVTVISPSLNDRTLMAVTATPQRFATVDAAISHMAKLKSKDLDNWRRHRTVPATKKRSQS